MKIRCIECGKAFYFRDSDYREVEKHIRAINDIMEKYYSSEVIDNFLSLLIPKRENLRCCPVSECNAFSQKFVIES